MPFHTPPASITAIVYDQGALIDTVMRDLAEHLACAGLHIAGLVQLNCVPPGRSRCDMVLKDLASGATVAISEDRGPEARGCRLDVGELMRASVLARQSLEARPDLFLVNKFGKQEAAGGGFRPVMAAAVEQGVPVLVAVPSSNLDAWAAFVGELSVNHRLDALPREPARLARALGLAVGDVASPTANGEVRFGTA